MKSKRFVLDTNVLVSAALFENSLPHKAFEKANKMGKLLVSTATLQELEKVLERTKFDKYLSLDKRKTFLAYIAQNAELVPVTLTIEACRDTKDNQFLEVAVCGKADAIITGDTDLLVLHPFENIPILSPKDFLEILW